MREVAARSLRRRGASVELLLHEGDPVEQIPDPAHEREVDLIALGPRKMMTLTKMFLGSVARDVFRSQFLANYCFFAWKAEQVPF